MLRGERIREKMKKKIIIAGICIIALCAVIVPKFTKPKQFAQAVALPVMDAEKPETGDIRLTTSVIGKIEPSDVVYIYPKAAGDVTEVNVKAGDVVTKGQVLCNIDTKQVESAKNTMDSAALHCARLRKNFPASSFYMQEADFLTSSTASIRMQCPVPR